MHVKKETIDEHFKNKKVNIGRGRFIKKIKDRVYAEAWSFFCTISFAYKKKIRMSDNTYGSVILHVESWFFL